MQKRIWDPNNKYQAGFLKGFNYWSVEISYRQHTLGSYIIFANRYVERFSEITEEESLELVKVMNEIEKAYSSIDTLNPDRFNYLQLGNSLHHLHIHGIPRYEKPRTFLDKQWLDATYGNVPTWSDVDESDDLVDQIRDLVSKTL